MSQRDVVRGNVRAILADYGITDLKNWCLEHDIERHTLYTKASSGITVHTLLMLCRELNVTTNELLKGLY